MTPSMHITSNRQRTEFMPEWLSFPTCWATNNLSGLKKICLVAKTEAEAEERVEVA